MAYVLGETKAIVIEENGYRNERFPIANKMQTARRFFFLLFCEKNKTNKFINNFVLKISSVNVLQQVGIKKRIIFLYCIVQYLFTDI